MTRRAGGALAALLLLAAPPGCRPSRTPSVPPAEQARKFLDVFPYPALSQADSDIHARLAPLQAGYLIYIQATDFPAAAAEFARVARENPGMVEARFLQGVSLVLAERPAEAVPVLEGVVKESPAYAPGRWFLGQGYFAIHEDAKAMEQMREVAALGELYAAEARKVVTAAE